LARRPRSTIRRRHKRGSSRDKKVSDKIRIKHVNARNVVVGKRGKITDKANVSTTANLPALAVELERLKQALIKEAASPAEYEAVAEIQAAEEAANAGDEPAVGRHLAKAGRWAMDVAVRIGAAMAAAALDHAIGMG
jgi:hypothetical protein